MPQALHHHARSTPGGLALVVGGRALDYHTLAELAARAATWLQVPVDAPDPRVAVWGRPSVAAFVGLLGARWAGAAYVPLDPRLPPARLRDVVAAAAPQALVVSSGEAARCRSLLGHALPPAVLALPDDLPDALGPLADVPPSPEPEPVRGDATAYVMFTSGTTGRPKGIEVTAANLAHFLDAVRDRYALSPTDRVAQYNALSFDLSVFDLYAAWSAGAAVVVVPEAARVNPVPFLRRQGISVWLSVPSVIGHLERLRQLTPGRLPRLRVSLFCGEAFPRALADAWRRAAPASIIDNLYGPTELTVACTAYRVEETNEEIEGGGTLPIGSPLPGLHAEVVGDDGAFLGHDTPGELWVAGPQVTRGYLGDVALTRARYPERPGPDGVLRRWYRTGDRVRRDPGGRLHYVGRGDTQVKIRGHRVELESVEHHLRAATGCHTVVVVPWPVEEGVALGSIAAVDRADLDAHAVRRALHERLPAWAIPQRLVHLDDFPRTSRGKLDREAVGALVRAAASERQP